VTIELAMGSFLASLYSKHMDKYCTVVVQMQRKPKAGANRTINTFAHILYMRNIKIIKHQSTWHWHTGSSRRCKPSLLLSPLELSWLVWDQSRSKYYLRTKFQDGIDKPQKCQNVCYHPTDQQQSDFLILVNHQHLN
jgi:hypothetical protein